MRIGIFFGEGGSLAHQIEQVVAYENDGFASVWFAQIFGPDALTAIALAGGRTKRIELGTAVVPV